MSSIFGDDSGRGVSMWRSEWSNIKTLQDQLDDQISASMSNQRRLSSQLSKLQGDLSQRVDRLSRAFDAFVELSELRDELTLHSEARRWRAAAKAMVESSVATGIAPSVESVAGLADVGGYWLVPAVKALPGVVSGHPDPELLAEAARRDEVRSTLFIAAASVMIARTDMVGAWVARAVSGAPFAPVTVGQRALWLAAADGEMNATSVETVRSELRRRLDAVPSEARAALVHGLVSFPPGTAPSATAKSNETATAANEMLRRWAAWCVQLSASGEVARPAVAAPATAGATGSPTPTNRGSDAVLDVVRSLVEEGSEPERELLDRAEALMATVRGSAASKGPEWGDEAGVVADLLAADLRQNTETGRARFALELMHAHLSEAADELARQAHAAPPSTTSFTVGGRSITVGPDGAAPADLAAAEAAVSRPAPSQVPKWSLPVAVVVAVVFAVLGIVTSPGWFVIAAIGVVVAAAVFVIDRRDAAERASAAATQRERLHKRVQESVAELQASSVAAAVAASDSDDLRRQIDESISAIARG